MAFLELDTIPGLNKRYLILVERDGGKSPYVVSRYQENAEEWESGAYIADKYKAIKYFAHKCV